jgi:hypothetical protein
VELFEKLARVSKRDRQQRQSVEEQRHETGEAQEDKRTNMSFQHAASCFLLLCAAEYSAAFMAPAVVPHRLAPGAMGRAVFTTRRTISGVKPSFVVGRSQGRRSGLFTLRAEVDYYADLGISKGADDAEIKSAFRQKARKLHPDVNKAPDAQQQFQKIQAAYEVLSDPQKKSMYDR